MKKKQYLNGCLTLLNHNYIDYLSSSYNLNHIYDSTSWVLDILNPGHIRDGIGMIIRSSNHTPHQNVKYVIIPKLINNEKKSIFKWFNITI